DVADLLGDHVTEDSAQGGQLQRRDVAGGDLPTDDDVEQLGGLAGKGREQLAEPVGQGYAGADQVVHGTAGDVHRTGEQPPGQRQSHGVRGRHARLLLRLGGGGPQVRGEGDVVQFEQLRGARGAGGRLRGVDIERGPGDASGRQGL